MQLTMINKNDTIDNLNHRLTQITELTSITKPPQQPGDIEDLQQQRIKLQLIRETLQTQAATNRTTNKIHKAKTLTDIQTKSKPWQTTTENESQQACVTGTMKTTKKTKRTRNKEKQLYTMTTVTPPSHESPINRYTDTTKPEISPDDTNNGETTPTTNILALAAMKIKKLNLPNNKKNHQ